MALDQQRSALLPTVLMLAGLAACGGKSKSAIDDPGSGGGSGDGSGGGAGATTLVQIGDAEGDEADTGTTILTFVVSLTQPREVPVTVAYSTQDGTAKSTGADADFQPTSGTLLFEPGATALEVRVFVHGDLEVESNETFSVTLSAPTGENVQLGDASGRGLIRNDDAYELSVDDITLVELDFSSQTADFPVRLSTPASSTITVQYVTENVNGSGAYPTGDYTWKRGTVVFPAGSVEQTVSIGILGGLDPEPEERFALRLFEPTGFDVVIEDDRALATVLDDDTPVQLDSASVDSTAARPRVALQGSLACVVWLDDREGEPRLFFDRSTDGGFTWSATDQRIDHAPPGAELSNVRIAMSGEHVYVVWQDDRDGRGDIFLNHSPDGGLTWQASDLRLDTDAPGGAHSRDPQLAVQGERVYVVWEDHRELGSQIRFNGSTDGGATWHANDLRVSSAPFPSPCSQPALAALGDHVYVVWADQRNGEADIYFDSSSDAGQSWRADDVPLETHRPGAYPAGAPHVACSPEGVFVVWEDDRDGETDIRFNRSIDHGDTWNADDERMEDDPAGAYDSRRPQIACDGASLVVTWEDDRGGLEDVYSRYSPDGGFTWGPNLRLSRGGPAGFSRSIRPELAFNGNSVLVLWLDDRMGQFDLYLNYSLNDGKNFEEFPLRVDADSDFESRDAVIAVDGDNYLLAWRERRATDDVLTTTIDRP